MFGAVSDGLDRERRVACDGDANSLLVATARSGAQYPTRGMAMSTLTREQLEEFNARGIVRVPRLVAAETAASVADRVWEILARRGIDRGDAATWPVGRASKLQALTQAMVYQPFDDALLPIADQILGAGRWLRPTGPGPLVSFPAPGPWVLPHKLWHFDLPARGSIDPPIALRLIGFVEPVGPRSGGTLVVEGSHELAARMVAASPSGEAGQSADVRRRLRRQHDWFRALFSAGGERDRFFDATVVGGVRVRVTELTGEAGDGFLMHPWTLHGFSQNTGQCVRSMLTHSVYSDGFRWTRGDAG